MAAGNQGDLKGFRSPLQKTIWLGTPLPGQISSLFPTILTCTHYSGTPAQFYIFKLSSLTPQSKTVLAPKHTIFAYINPQLSQIKQTIKLSTQMIKKLIDTPT